MTKLNKRKNAIATFQQQGKYSIKISESWWHTWEETVTKLYHLLTLHKTSYDVHKITVTMLCSPQIIHCVTLASLDEPLWHGAQPRRQQSQFHPVGAQTDRQTDYQHHFRTNCETKNISKSCSCISVHCAAYISKWLKAHVEKHTFRGAFFQTVTHYCSVCQCLKYMAVPSIPLPSCQHLKQWRWRHQALPLLKLKP